MIYKAIITETIHIKNKEFKVSNIDYNKKVYVFGLLIYDHTYLSKQNDVENNNNKNVGFKHK
jgi:hypothetical protein